MTQATPRAAARLACALALFTLAAGAPANAQETYPARPIRLVVGFGAGGPTDIPARFVADKLGEAIGQRVVVENKPAAAGMIATRDVFARLKALLMDYAKPQGDAMCVEVRLTHQEIASRIGCTREMVSRIMRDLTTAGYSFSESVPAEITYESVSRFRRRPGR